MNENLNLDSTWKKSLVPRGKCHNKTETKTTVSLYLNKTLVEKARIHKLNLSKVAENAILSILDYLEAQRPESSQFLTEGSFPKETSVVPRAGFEPATTRSSAERSPRLSYLGNAATSKEKSNPF
jgi:hypothetical protein